jgi:hypothetical protein
MVGDSDLTPEELEFVERCAGLGVPVDVVEYELDLAMFDIGEGGDHAGGETDVYVLAWQRIKARY